MVLKQSTYTRSVIISVFVLAAGIQLNAAMPDPNDPKRSEPHYKGFRPNGLSVTPSEHQDPALDPEEAADLTQLRMALNFNRTDVIEQLCSQGVDVTHVLLDDQTTALIMATGNNNHRAVTAIMESFAADMPHRRTAQSEYIAQNNYNQITALSIAAEHGYHEILTTLMQYHPRLECIIDAVKKAARTEPWVREQKLTTLCILLNGTENRAAMLNAYFTVLVEFEFWGSVTPFDDLMAAYHQIVGPALSALEVQLIIQIRATQLHKQELKRKKLIMKNEDSDSKRPHRDD